MTCPCCPHCADGHAPPLPRAVPALTRDSVVGVDYRSGGDGVDFREVRTLSGVMLRLERSGGAFVLRFPLAPGATVNIALGPDAAGLVEAWIQRGRAR